MSTYSKSSSVLVLVGLLTILSVGISLILTRTGVSAGVVVLLSIVSFVVVLMILNDFRVGVFVLVIYATFMFFLDRLLTLSFPQGVIYDALALITFLAVFLGKGKDWRGFRNPITTMFFIVTCYMLLQVLNPSGVPAAWLVSLRNHTSFLLYVVFFLMLSSVARVRAFTLFWCAIAFLVACYGIYQEKVGLPEFEYQWITSVEERYRLYFIWGKMRKFSFLSDPSSFGLYTAFAGLATLVLAFGPFSTALRLFFGLTSVLSFISMSYSGTRTAYAMAAIGLMFFFLVTIRNRNTLIAAILLGVVAVVILFGPFYGGTVNRIRSTFRPSEDASMEVRDIKRIRLQSYVLAHPIGGGLYTTGQNGLRYAAGHPLAEGWDPDSGYLLMALEMGWIGLILFQIFFFMVVRKGITNHFSIGDRSLQTYNLAYIVPYFALTIAHFTQDAVFTKPVNLLALATYALMHRLPSFEKKLESVDLV